MHWQKRVDENAMVNFLRHRKLRMHWFIAHYLLLRTWEERRHELCSSRLRGLSLGAFINSTWKNRIAYHLCNRKRFDSLPVVFIYLYLPLRQQQTDADAVYGRSALFLVLLL